MEKIRTLNNEDYESLLVLHHSPHWAVYKRILNQNFVAKSFTELSITDGEAILKSVGERAGINYAINLLDQLAEEHKRRLQKAEERT
jgi:hypothetical protein